MDKPKLCINMITKSPFYKQIIISMSENNINKFMVSSSNHVSNLNCTLKGIKPDTFIDFIYKDYWGLIIIANKVVSISDINIVENYIKNIQSVDASEVQSAWLPQSKLYPKILSISYLLEGTNTFINTSMVKTIIKSTYIFNDIHFVSKLYIIKVSPKSNIVIIWIDIWNSQCGSLAKMLINQCFNVGSYITMVQGAYMNSSISQCKNC